MADTPQPEPPSWLEREPPALRFGTSGLRGLVTDMTDLEVSINTTGFLCFLQEEGSLATGETVVIGGDLRASTDRLLHAVAHGVESAGCRVECAGRLPTPALTRHGLRTDRVTIMVTGSHIPTDRNGLKFNRRDGEVLKADEVGILAAVARARRATYAQTAGGTPFDRTGSLSAPPPLPSESTDAADGYRRRYLEAFPANFLHGQRLVVFQHAAVGRDLLTGLLRDLGAEVIPMGRTDGFVPLDTEDVGAQAIERYREMLAAAGGANALVSTDGDGDRPLLVDENAGHLRGDVLGAVVARWLGARRAVVPVSVNDAVDRLLAPVGIALRRTRIGSPWVVAAMQEEAAEHDGVVGWEANGGFLTAGKLQVPGGGVLGPLPTRDAVLPLLAALGAAAQAGPGVAALRAGLPARFAQAALLDDFAPADSAAILAAFSLPAGSPLDVVRGESGWQQPAPDAGKLSAATGSALDDIAARLATCLPTEAGLGAITRLNFLDGVRATFAGGEVLHVRPSGNAPQLRIYAVADSAARADALVRLGIAEPDGLLRRLQRATRGA